MNKDEIVKNIVLSLTDNYNKDKNNWKTRSSIFDRCWYFNLELDINGDGEKDGDITAMFEFKKETYNYESFKLRIDFENMSEDIYIQGYSSWKGVEDKNTMNLLEKIYKDKLEVMINGLKSSTTDEDILNDIYKSVGKKKRRNDTIDSILTDIKESKGTNNKSLSDKIDEAKESIKESIKVEKKKGFFSRMFGGE